MMKISELKGKCITGSMVLAYFKSPFGLWCNLHAPTEERDPKSDFYTYLSNTGVEHENNFVEENYPGMTKVSIETVEEVLESFKKGVEAFWTPPIFVVEDGLLGIPDLLERNNSHNSLFGKFHYIVKEVKSAKNLKDYHIMQAAFYNFVLGKMQGYTPRQFFLINGEGLEFSFEYSEYEKSLIAALDKIKLIFGGLEPSPTFGTEYPWGAYSEKRAFETKDVSLVIGISEKTKKQFINAGFNSYLDVAGASLSDLQGIKGIGPGKAKSMKMSAEALKTNKAVVISKPSFADAKTEIFFDLEFTAPDIQLGIENSVNYLFGMQIRDKGKEEFVYVVAESLDDEITAFKKFLKILDSYEDYVVYHYSHPEKSNLKRLFEVTNINLDKYFSNFVDLLPIIKKSVALPTTGYGLKPVAKYIGFNWRQEDVNATETIVLYLEYLEDGDKKKLQKIIDYNEDDCKATMVIKDYLKKLSD